MRVAGATFNLKMFLKDGNTFKPPFEGYGLNETYVYEAVCTNKQTTMNALKALCKTWGWVLEEAQPF